MRKIIRLLFLPIAIALWIVGWIMLWAGSSKGQQNQQAKTRTLPDEENISVTPATLEEPEQNKV